MSSPVIDITDLSKSYGRDRGIEHVSLEVEEGEIFGFHRAQRSRQIDNHQDLAEPDLSFRRNSKDHGYGRCQGIEKDQAPYRICPF